MVRDELAIYLTLAPEFGGTRFGPYEGMEVRLGSAPDRSNIVLPESFGVAKDHAKVMRSQDTGLVVAPAERTAAVWVWKNDARRPVQILTATAVRSGDSFALVSPDGPKFSVEIAPLPAEMIQARRSSNKGIKGLTGDRLAQAGWSLFMARLYAFSPVQMVASLYYRVKSGAIFNPRNFLLMIMGGAAMVGPMVGGAIAWLKNFEIKSKDEEITDLRSQVDTLAEIRRTGIENMQSHQLIAQATGTAELSGGMEKDTVLLGKVKDQARVMVQDIGPYSWLLTGDSRVEQFIEWRKTIEKADDIDKITRRLLTFAAADGKSGIHNFDQIKDSDDKSVCGRGPLRLTYRQGRSLGLEKVQADRYVLSDELALAQDPIKRADMLRPIAEAALGTPWPDPPPETEIEDITSGSEACAFVTGDDDRLKISELKKALVKHLGKDASFTPQGETGGAAIARLAKLYAADIVGNSYAGPNPPLISFKSGIAVALQDRSQWPVERTARVIARSAVLPCKAALSKDAKKLEEVFGALPDPITCLVLFYKLENE